MRAPLTNTRISTPAKDARLAVFGGLLFAVAVVVALQYLPGGGS